MKKFILGFVVWVVVFLGATHVFAQKSDSRASVGVTTSSLMQPFGVGAEDDDTAQLHVQPTHSPQVTAHSLFIQGSR